MVKNLNTENRTSNAITVH